MLRSTWSSGIFGPSSGAVSVSRTDSPEAEWRLTSTSCIKGFGDEVRTSGVVFRLDGSQSKVGLWAEMGWYEVTGLASWPTEAMVETTGIETLTHEGSSSEVETSKSSSRGVVGGGVGRL